MALFTSGAALLLGISNALASEVAHGGFGAEYRSSHSRQILADNRELLAPRVENSNGVNSFAAGTTAWMSPAPFAQLVSEGQPDAFKEDAAKLSIGIVGGAESGLGPSIRFGSRSYAVQVSGGYQPLLRFVRHSCYSVCWGPSFGHFEGIGSFQANSSVFVTPFHLGTVNGGFSLGYKYSSELGHAPAFGLVVRDTFGAVSSPRNIQIQLGVARFSGEDRDYWAIVGGAASKQLHVGLSLGLDWNL